MNLREDLIKHLKENTRVLDDVKVEEAFREIDRKDFVTADYEVEAYEDYPLPIGGGQTISQPTTVAYMFELLGPEEGDNILDIGSGSGWTTALLAKIVGEDGEDGEVTGLEVVPELVETGRRNLGKYGFGWARIKQAKEGEVGLKKGAPYDKILVSAAFSDEVPEELFNQLKVGGVLVAPVGASIIKYKKTGENNLEEERHPGFAFVPYVSV